MGWELGGGEGSNRNSGKKYPKGVFIDLIKITKCDNSNSDYTDISIYVEGTSDRAKYPKKFFLGGNHYKEQDVPVGWGSSKNKVKNGSWKIAGFIKACGASVAKDKLMTADGQLTDELLQDLIGRKVWILQYESTGKYSRDVWYYFGNYKGGDDFLLEKWKSMDSPPNKYKHQSSNRKLNDLWKEMPSNGNDKEDLSFLD